MEVFYFTELKWPADIACFDIGEKCDLQKHVLWELNCVKSCENDVPNIRTATRDLDKTIT